MNENMPRVAAIRSQTATREETMALLQQIAQDASAGAAQINVACVVLSRIMLMGDVGMDRMPLYPHFEALILARDEMVQAVVAFQEALNELESNETDETA